MVSIIRTYKCRLARVYRICLGSNTAKLVYLVNNYFTHGDLLILMKIQTTDTYVTCIRQVAALLGYGEPQILEVFKNTLPTKLYWILFPIEDLRQVVEIAKRILNKEKLRQAIDWTNIVHTIYEY